MNKIFISYSRKDEAFARQLATLLAEAGAEIWLDVDDIPAGVKWNNAIQEGLDSADALLLIVSAASMSSRNVEDEWMYFHSHNKIIIPVVLEKVSLPFQLNSIQWVDFSDPASKFLESYRKLLTALSNKGITLNTAIGTAPFQVKGVSAPAQTGATPAAPASRLNQILSSPLWQGVGGIMAIIGVIIAVIALNGSNNQPPAMGSATNTPVSSASTNDTATPATTSTPKIIPTGDGSLGITVTYSSADSLTILVEQDSDFSNLAFKTAIETISIGDYFDGLALANNQMTAGSCLRFVLKGETPPLPRACDRASALITEVDSGDVFWYDTVTQQPASMSLLRGDESLGICSAAVAAASGCSFAP